METTSCTLFFDKGNYEKLHKTFLTQAGHTLIQRASLLLYMLKQTGPFLEQTWPPGPWSRGQIWEELQGEEDGEWSSTFPDSQRGLLQQFNGVEGVTEREIAKLHPEFR